MKYAGSGQRFLAYLIDVVVTIIVSVVFGIILGLVVGKSSSTLMISTLFNIIFYVSYWVIYQSKSGQTIGKKMMNIKVVDSSGKVPGVGTFFLRDTVGKIVSGIIIYIGFLMILWDSKKQGLHDKIAGTYVIKA